MKGQIDGILEDLYNDLSLNKEDQEELDKSCKNFILGELEKIKITFV